VLKEESSSELVDCNGTAARGKKGAEDARALWTEMAALQQELVMASGGL
jgi:hypothetical protein